MAKIGFSRIERQGGIWDEYIGKWVLIRVPGVNFPYAGRCIEIKGDYAVLSPFQDGDFNEDNGYIYRMNDGRSLVPLIGSPIEPTTKKNIENYCKYHNKKNLEERLKEKEEKRDLNQEITGQNP